MRTNSGAVFYRGGGLACVCAAQIRAKVASIGRLGSGAAGTGAFRIRFACLDTV